MADRTAIEWADATWNPIQARGEHGRWLCARVSPGCAHCYASRLNVRFGGGPYPAASTDTLQGLRVAVLRGTVVLDAAALEQPRRWRRPRRVFVGSMTDLCGEWVPLAWLQALWEAMRAAPQHTYLVLTKRPRQLVAFLRELGPTPPPALWLGVSVEDAHYAWRARDLARARVPEDAAGRFVSAEPLLGPLADALPWGTFQWLIVGGESGGPPARRLVAPCRCGPPQAPDGGCGACHGTGWAPRPEALEWVRDLRDAAQTHGVAFCFKQWGGPRPTSGGRLLDGRTWDAGPTPTTE